MMSAKCNVKEVLRGSDKSHRDIIHVELIRESVFLYVIKITFYTNSYELLLIFVTKNDNLLNIYWNTCCYLISSRYQMKLFTQR